MTDDEFDSHTRQLLDHIDARIESADDDAKKVHQSISQFIEKASQIEEGVDDALELMAYNFMLTDQVLHDHLNVFSIISLLTLLQADDAAARALVRHSATAKARHWVLSEWAKYGVSEYGGNKTKFCETYVRLLPQRFNTVKGDPLKVSEKQMREVWLKSPPTGKPAGLPADGE